jgi:hypothetical protein
MESSVSAETKFDLTIISGTAIALLWILYVDPLTGDLLALTLGTVPVVLGVVRYVDSEQYVSQALTGVAAVALGGATPATVLTDTPAANWLVGSQPLPLALGWLLVVVILALVGRRSLRAAFRTEELPAA